MIVAVQSQAVPQVMAEIHLKAINLRRAKREARYKARYKHGIADPVVLMGHEGAVRIRQTVAAMTVAAISFNGSTRPWWRQSRVMEIARNAEFFYR